MRGNHGGPFGAVVIRRGKIIGRGWNRVTSTNDPTAHAEVIAIREACHRLKKFRLDDCELYTSCEPCPMCLAAGYWARLRKIYYGNTRRDAAKIGFDDEALYREVARPISRRKIFMKQLLRPEALKVFAEWKTKPDKICY
jgi:tRNA(Arg) A34 adenosine deaminase TadA